MWVDHKERALDRRFPTGGTNSLAVLGLINNQLCFIFKGDNILVPFVLTTDCTEDIWTTDVLKEVTKAPSITGLSSSTTWYESRYLN